MARVVVTGAAGFVGGAIAHALRGRGDEVVALDVARGPGVHAADVSRPGDWEKELVGVDLVVHAAAVGMGGVGELPRIRGGRPAGRARVPAARMRQVLLGGTATVLDAAARGGARRLVHLSCVSVLGPDIADGVDETAPVGLTGDARADTLAAAEQAVSAATASGLPATILRLGDAYGPRAGRWTVWPVLLLRAGRFVLLDGGAGWLNPVHIDDVVAAVLAAAGTDRARGETLHVTGPSPCTVAEFAGYYSRMLELPAPRSVPARMYGALDDATLAVGRMRGRVESRRGGRSEPGDALAASAGGGQGRANGDAGQAGAVGPSVGSTALGVVRGLGARLAAGVDPRTRMDLGPLTVADVTRTGRCSGDRITALTGWRPGVELADGMGRTEAWLRERGLLGVREPSRRG
ncbi:NAD-dependent epimerase/dehydratase family protein [Frankia sp. CNm7]|uniref:NAD-dependent epimerase/dehydratase family protein n=1 Tax=Frankia nepalensis TaxID=1836974 RepID=A0A937UT51_9ACTN|nr:NAD(P)-dependent oxidoreductase [Frankia nepalensis]MBL7501346.1 NAD-dependent epimerase/dehydratase family protein [Frankia nepalensis]MBL7509867.1 NAD-dependent epimerase/dehydratase family protein [Frankia nepalensis]MBL7520694.1 NAD-dependent epimerase/dehydratase family protein [Frankia nepalensis]MBL7629626.1 NAD-dependent epimerase/dehydratase family protein [Frankia nepalensis]